MLQRSRTSVAGPRRRRLAGAFTRDRLAEVGVALPAPTVAPNFLPSREFATAPPAEEPRHVLFAGRLGAEKGVETVIEAAARARLPLAIAGAGPEEQRLRAL